MSFKTTGFKGIVYGSDIETSTCLIDYINGKGQFYIENTAYPLIKPGAKKPFIDNDYSSKYGTQVHSPSICYKTDKETTSRFMILWGENKADFDKTVRVLYPYGGIDEKTGAPIKTASSDGKFKKLTIPLTDVEDPSRTIDNQKLNLLSFHLTEDLSYLAFGYCAGVDFAKKDFKDLTTNREYNHAFTDEFNNYLASKKCKYTLKYIDDDMISHYNDEIYYRDDKTVKGKVKPKVPHYKYMDGTEARYVRLETLLDKMKELADEIAENDGDIGKYFTGAKQELMSNLCFCQALKNSNTLRTYTRTTEDGEEGETVENFQIKGTFSIKQYKVDGPIDKLAGLCTQIYDPATKHYKPIEAEEQLMEFYKSRINGLIYLELYFTIGMFKETTIGLNTRIAKMDVTKVVATSSGDDEAARLSEMRRRTTTAEPVVEQHHDERDEISDNGEDF